VKISLDIGNIGTIDVLCGFEGASEKHNLR